MNRFIALQVFAVALAVPLAADDAVSFVAPRSIPAKLTDRISAEKKDFAEELNALIASDKDGLLFLVDKTHPLPAGFVPAGLVPLRAGKSYVAGKDGLSLRPVAEAALGTMAAGAKKDGVTLVASSTYRSFDYQKIVYERIVSEMGQAAADRESARPGTSQHQTGLAMDFGSITDEFAATKAGKWLAANAGAYGWSLSFPQGYESVTGYRWECWHYRYIGVDAVTFQDKWFGGVQQYMMEFIDAWKKAGLDRAKIN